MAFSPQLQNQETVCRVCKDALLSGKNTETWGGGGEICVETILGDYIVPGIDANINLHIQVQTCPAGPPPLPTFTPPFVGLRSMPRGRGRGGINICSVGCPSREWYRDKGNAHRSSRRGRCRRGCMSG